MSNLQKHDKKETEQGVRNITITNTLYAFVRKRVALVMGGKILEYEAKTIKRESMKEGNKKDRKESIRTLIDSLRSFSIPNDTSTEQLIQRYQLNKEEASNLVKSK